MIIIIRYLIQNCFLLFQGCNATAIILVDSELCSESKCCEYLCKIKRFSAYADHNPTLNVRFLNEDKWNDIVTEKEQFWITAEFKVTKEANYETDVKKLKMPKNSQGQFNKKACRKNHIFCPNVSYDFSIQFYCKL